MYGDKNINRNYVYTSGKCFQRFCKNLIYGARKECQVITPSSLKESKADPWGQPASSRTR